MLFSTCFNVAETLSFFGLDLLVVEPRRRNLLLPNRLTTWSCCWRNDHLVVDPVDRVPEGERGHVDAPGLLPPPQHGDAGPLALSSVCRQDLFIIKEMVSISQ